MLEEQNYETVYLIITRYMNTEYIRTKLLTPQWERSAELKFSIFTQKLSDIDNTVQEVQDLQVRKRKIE